MRAEGLRRTVQPVHPTDLARLDRAHGMVAGSSGMWTVDDDTVERRWEREQALLGLARGTPGEEFARGGRGALAVDPTVRIAVLPGDPSAQPIPAASPEAVIPKVITLPGDVQLPYHGTVRGTSSGYMGFTTGNDGRWKSFDAVPGTAAWTCSSAPRAAGHGRSARVPGSA